MIDGFRVVIDSVHIQSRVHPQKEAALLATRERGPRQSLLSRWANRGALGPRKEIGRFRFCVRVALLRVLNLVIA
jgi:hypothetical protein